MNRFFRSLTVAAIAAGAPGVLLTSAAQTHCVTVNRLVTTTVYHPDGSYTVTRRLVIETVCSPAA